jgi:rRNA maturation RNase YbeY
MINVQIEIDSKIVDPKINQISRLVSEVMKSEGRADAEIQLIFTNDNVLSDLKKKYFNQDHFTDVIAFRLNDYNENKVEGEVYISVPQVEKNAKKYDQSFDKELARIIIHGSLHLLDYKDGLPDEKLQMTKKEDHYLNTLIWKNIV